MEGLTVSKHESLTLEQALLLLSLLETMVLERIQLIVSGSSFFAEKTFLSLHRAVNEKISIKQQNSETKADVIQRQRQTVLSDLLIRGTHC